MPVIIDPETGEEVYHADRPQLNERGGEVLNPQSLVSIIDSKPISLGARLARFAGQPEFMKLADKLPYGDDVTDPDEPPMSKHEERYVSLMERTRKRIDEERETKTKQIEEKSKAEKDRLRTALREIMQEANSQPTGGA